MHHPQFKHGTKKEQMKDQEKKQQKNIEGVRKRMKSDVGKYRLLQKQLEEVRVTIQNISEDENPTLVKAKLLPILNRVTAYNEWFNGIGEKEEEKGKLAKFREMMKDPEKRKKLVEAAANL